MRFSFVIPALDEQKYIAKCIRSIKRQTKNSEIIVVDNGSTDNTTKLAREAGAEVVIEKKRGLSNARNAGAKAATGDIVCFIDADGELGRNWLKACNKSFESDTDLVSGFIVYKNKSLLKKLYYNSYLFFAHPFLFITHKLTKTPYVIGNNVAFRKKSFLKIGGFPPFVAEDFWLTQKLAKAKYKGKLNTKMIVHYSSRGFESAGYIKTIIYWAKAASRKVPQNNYSYKNKTE